jgi:HK97 family phage prohead protease
MFKNLNGQAAVKYSLSGDVKRAAEMDPKTSRAKFVISTENVDRVGDIVRQKGLSLKTYETNNVVLFNHRHDAIIGNGHARKSGTTTYGDVEFMAAGISPLADTVKAMVGAGVLKATSIGFKPLKYEVRRNEDGYFIGLDIKESELLEFSIVTIPANADCLSTAKSLGIDIEHVKQPIEAALDEWDMTPMGVMAPRDILERAYQSAWGGKTISAPANSATTVVIKDVVDAAGKKIGFLIGEAFFKHKKGKKLPSIAALDLRQPEPEPVIPPEPKEVKAAEKPTHRRVSRAHLARAIALAEIRIH